MESKDGKDSSEEKEKSISERPFINVQVLLLNRRTFRVSVA